MNKTVLIVDDSELVLKIISNKLKKAGYDILQALDGKQALKLLDGNSIDLLITDLNMPEMDGVELINAVRTNPYYQFIPIILFLSDEVPDKRFMKKSGATIFFDKASMNAQIVATVKKLIR